MTDFLQIVWTNDAPNSDLARAVVAFIGVLSAVVGLCPLMKFSRRKLTDVGINHARDAAIRNPGVIPVLHAPKKTLDAYERALEHDPDDLESLFWAGHLLINRGILDAAHTRLDRVLSLATEEQSFYRFWAQLYLGDILPQPANLPDALNSYPHGLAIAERLALADPSNADWQRNLSASYNRLGDVLKAQGNLPEALKSYRDELAIAERLAQADPGNVGWQHDLPLSYDKIGDALEAQGHLPEALKWFRDGLAIRDRLAQSDPRNANWQRDLSASYNKIGDIVATQGDLAAAVKLFRDRIASRGRPTP